MRGAVPCSAWALSVMLGVTSASWGQTPGALSQSTGIGWVHRADRLGGPMHGWASLG